MLHIKFEFVRSDNKERVVVEFDATCKQVSGLNVMLEIGSDGHKYVWPYGSFNVFQPEGNVLYAKFIETDEIHIHVVRG